MNAKQNKQWKRQNNFNYSKKKDPNYYDFGQKCPPGMVDGANGPVSKSKRIAEKNAAKGQDSLNKFFNGKGIEGIKSNRAAFEHYAKVTNAYSEDYASKVKNPEEQQLVLDAKPKPRDQKSFLKGYQETQKKAPGAIARQLTITKHLEEKIDYSNLVIWSWNVNGIRAIVKKNRIQEFFEKAQPAILCVQESKIDEERMIAENLKDKFPADYLQYWNCCKPPIRGYAGTIIFTRIKPLNVYYDIGTPKHDREGRTITLEFEKFFLVGVYVPNSGATLKWHEYRVNEWDLDFRAYLKGLERKGKPVILCGDLNVAHQDIDIYDPKRNEQMACFTPQERQSFSNYLKMGFCDTFRELYPGKIKYSFWDIRDKSRKENKGWRLDYMCISQACISSVIDSEIHNEFWGSDHCPVSLTVNIDKIDVDNFNEHMTKFDGGELSDQIDDDDDEERKSELDMEDNMQELDEAGEDDLEDEMGIDQEGDIELGDRGNDFDEIDDVQGLISQHSEDGMYPRPPQFFKEQEQPQFDERPSTERKEDKVSEEDSEAAVGSDYSAD